MYPGSERIPSTEQGRGPRRVRRVRLEEGHLAALTELMSTIVVPSSATRYGPNERGPLGALSG